MKSFAARSTDASGFRSGFPFGPYSIGRVTNAVRNPTAFAAVPDVYEYTPQQAALEVERAGLIPAFGPASGQWVKSQSPDAGNLVPQGSTVTMDLASGPKP